MVKLVWLREDLRISDNPALTKACESDDEIIAIFIYDNEANSSDYYAKIGGAATWWLHKSLQDVRKSLNEIGIQLIFRIGNAKELIPQFAKDVSADSVFWNRIYDDHSIKRDSEIKNDLKKKGINVQSFKDKLLFEPWEISKGEATKVGVSQEDQFYRVFTPFWKKCCSFSNNISMPLKKIESVKKMMNFNEGNLDELVLKSKNWSQKFEKHWVVGEVAAQNALYEFLDNAICDYNVGRDFMDRNSTSKLSPYLRFGQISPKQIWHATKYHLEINLSQGLIAKNVERFLSEIGWREFSYHLLYHLKDLPTQPFRPAFRNFPWSNDVEMLEKWQKAETGFPIIDAAMRELWETGYMHNRARMVVGSFLTKDLLIPWQEGAKWFWDCLVDADLANNSASWQWVAGCGADAAPYFRIFNPILQAQKFDPNGYYVRKWLPELSKLSNAQIHDIQQVKNADLLDAGVKIGINYPKAIIDRKFSRKRALDAYNTIKSS